MNISDYTEDRHNFIGSTMKLACDKTGANLVYLRGENKIVLAKNGSVVIETKSLDGLVSKMETLEKALA